MRITLTLKFYLIFGLALSQVDTSNFIKVNFLYGSKPKRHCRSTEPKYFGGLHGGHVTIQAGDIDYGFVPTSKRVHIFSKRKHASDFVDQQLYGQNRNSADSKTVTFIIPLSDQQKLQILQILKCYADTVPYDYAFFGMRCASTTQDILGQIGVVKQRKRFFNIASTFYPKKLRKRLFRYAKKNDYQIVKTDGRPTRRWERD